VLIRQNVKVVCESDYPEYLQAQGESLDTEGYFCKLNYKGARDIKKTPPKVTVSIKVQSDLYQRVLKTIEVKLVSGVTVERMHSSGVNLASNQRGQQITVISVGDFDVSAKPEDKISVKKARHAGNEFSVYVKADDGVNSSFTGNLIFKNKHLDRETYLPVYYS